MYRDNFDREDSLIQMRTQVPNFNEQELLEFTKIIIPNIHILSCDDEFVKLKKYCSEELIEKIKNDKELYRISKNIDNVRVGYTRLEGFVKKDDKFFIKVYSSVFFYDNIDNNDEDVEYGKETGYEFAFDKYWNDIWVVTFEGKDTKDVMNKCPTCGAPMEYNLSKHMFTCEYCRNSVYYSQINWKVVDIDVNGIKYK